MSSYKNTMCKDKKLFAGANTPDGFVGFYDRLVDMYDLKKLYILKGGSGIGKSTFIKNFAKIFKDEDKDYLICSGDPNSLDGVIIPGKKIGIIDGTEPHLVDPIYPGIVDEIINLGDCIIWDKVKATRDQFKQLASQKKQHYALAFEQLKKARDVHHKIEALYNGAVDYDAINLKLNKIIMQHIDNMT